MPGNGVPRLAAERRRAIVAELRANGRLEVAETADRFETSVETIRKDLISLEKRGLLRRVHGGALPVQTMTFEPDVTSRVSENRDEKVRIGTRALTHLPERGVVMIDAGSTTQLFTEMLPNRSDLRVFTNSLIIASIAASKPSIICHTLGGRIRPTTMAEVGATARRSLESLHFDIAFVGTNAVSPKRGLYTPDPDEAAVKQDMIANSERVILLADHRKFGQHSLVRYADLSEIDVVITGAELHEDFRHELAAAGVEMEYV
ncbi:MAG TPA: DeoR/GlpR family DNA-binding transcription regulator [Actinomycetaceae bacterium]|nr:DeoR/GlpR family DNA-binding transcription regulator [Actinomycetaceae bacterium]